MLNSLWQITHSCVLFISMLLLSACTGMEPMATGDMGVLIERATGSVQIINTSSRISLARVEGLGDLSHASIVYSRNERFAYVFGRDGGLTKVDILKQKIERRIMQSGNSIGGAISQDGKLVAVSNYEPGGVRVFDADSLELVADIPALYADGQRSKVVGLVDAPGQRFVFSLYDAGEIWIADFSQHKLDKNKPPEITKFKKVGKQPYDGLISSDGRYYIAGLFGEDGLVLLDLWKLEMGVRRILDHYGRGKRQMPVYKMPHLEGWAIAGKYAFLPAVGFNEVLVVSLNDWKEVTRIAVHGQPVFVMARPDGRQIWVNFAFPNNDTVEIFDTLSFKKIQTLKPGKAVLHMEFTPRGEEVWISARDDNRVSVYNTKNFKLKAMLNAEKPSGIFMTYRAHRIGL
ncbi:Heme d1 biosynthesis protein NirF [hydrothermal vent metagenome]|uniref:Heme d1 biosynthesis protein NirF n=1 Tax=hydrothermal vent metagenome TaxID=652676 RepID=A0A3B1BCJ1_9ZZZZ